jgi:hypothetical protein
VEEAATRLRAITERMGALPTLATHDNALGLAARSFSFDVRGV